MEGLARAGNGTAEFVKEGERMQPKVLLVLATNYIAPKHQRGYALQNHWVTVKLGCRNMEQNMECRTKVY